MWLATRLVWLQTQMRFTLKEEIVLVLEQALEQGEVIFVIQIHVPLQTRNKRAMSVGKGTQDLKDSKCVATDIICRIQGVLAH